MTRWLLVPLTLLVCAAPARADHVTIGSDLTPAATLTQSHQRDWAAWPTAVSGGGGIVAPVQGEVSMVQVKGTVLKPDNDAAYNGKYPGFVFHVVVLRPQSDGTDKLMLSSADQPYPFGGDDQQITTFSLQGPSPSQQARMCVVPGDIVAIATSGGFGNHTAQFGGFPDDFYANGYPVKMFARVPGMGYKIFKQPAGSETFQVGHSVTGEQQSDQELLMRATIGTGADARYFCRTPAEQGSGSGNAPRSAKATVVAPAGSPKVKHHAFKVALSCPAGSLPCDGTLKLSNRSTLYATAPFTLAAGAGAKIKLVLNRTARKALKHRLTVKATATTDAGSTSQRFVIRK
jgi:hypothetical protein